MTATFAKSYCRVAASVLKIICRVSKCISPTLLDYCPVFYPNLWKVCYFLN